MFKRFLPIFTLFLTYAVLAEANLPKTNPFLPTVFNKTGKSFAPLSKKTLPDVTINMSNLVANKTGDTACVILSAKNFQNVGAIDFAFAFDSTVLQFTGIKSRGINVTASDYSLYRYGSDLVFLTWIDIAGKTVADDAPIFELCFKTIGNACARSPIRLVDTLGPPSNLDDPNGNKLPITSVSNGSVTISCQAFSANVAADSALCNGGASGRIRVTPTTTSGPFRYRWQNQSNATLNGSGSISTVNTTDTIKNLLAGSYFVTVYNSSNDSVVRAVEIKQPDRIFILLPEILNPCPGQTNGRITFQNNLIGGGTPPYSYRWSTGATTLSISDLGVGAYEVTVTDSRGCTESNRYTLGAISISITSQNVIPALCKEARNGSIEINGVTGGTVKSGNYTFRWSNNQTNVGPTSINPNLGAGSFTVTISDDNNCTLIQPFTVASTRLLQLTATITNVTCFGSANGSVRTSMRATGSENPPYTFRWDSRVVNPVETGGRNSLAQNLNGGIYTLNVKDADGCAVDTFFTVTEPSEILLNAVIKNPGCVGLNDGEITVNPTGGGTPYTYRWSPLTSNTTNRASGLTAGTYVVVVTDRNNCAKDSTIILRATQGPKIDNFDIKGATCFDRNDGEIAANITPAPNTTITGYTWSNGGSTAKTTGLFRGIYYLTVTSSDGCRAIDSARVGSPPQLRFDTSGFMIDNPRCPADSNGTILLAAQGGTTPYRFFWSGGQPTSNPRFLGLKKGTYTFTVTDFNLCPSIDTTITLTAPPDIQLAYVNKERTNCNGECVNGKSDGKVTVVPSGGNGTGIFTYQWSSGETTDRAVQLCGGWQKVSVSDNQCVKIDSVFIEQPEAFTVQARTIAEPTCNGDSDGSIEVVTQGGSRPYTYSWSNGVTNTNGILSNILAGIYSVVITDANNCRYKINDYTLEQPRALKVDTIADKTTDVQCYGQKNAQIYLQVSGGNGGRKTFRWTDNISQGDSVINIGAGTYNVTVTDLKGCDTVFTYTVNQPDPIYFTGVTVTPPICNGGDAFITVKDAFGGTKLYPFFFTVDEGPLTQLGTDFLVLAGEHKVKVVEQFTECALDTIITIKEPPAIQIGFSGDRVEKTTEGYRVIVGLGNSIRLNPDLTSSLPIDTAKTYWTPTTYLTLTGDLLRPFTRPLDDITYKLIVTDLNGCRDSASIDVELERDRNLFIPNIFSPNDDGDDRNNIFTVFSGPGVKKVNFMRIYDRWGELLYSRNDLPVSSEPSVGWDGKINGTLAMQGVYVYLVEVEFEDGTKLLYRGDLTLIR